MLGRGIYPCVDVVVKRNGTAGLRPGRRPATGPAGRNRDHPRSFINFHTHNIAFCCDVVIKSRETFRRRR